MSAPMPSDERQAADDVRRLLGPPVEDFNPETRQFERVQHADDVACSETWTGEHEPVWATSPLGWHCSWCMSRLRLGRWYPKAEAALNDGHE